VINHLNFMLLGTGNGAVFAALAVALVMVYRSSGVLNFATGALALHAAYTYAFLRQGELLIPIPPLPSTVDVGGDWGLWPAMMFTVALEALVGVVLYLVVFRPLRSRAPVTKAVASLGVVALFTGMIAEQAGTGQVIVKPIFPRKNFEIGSLRFVGDRVFLAVTILAIAFIFAALSRYTRFGLATRASAESEVGALVSGLSPERIAMINWALSAAVAGLAGILIAPLTPLLPATYTLFVVPALAAAVLGNFSALLPAAFGGLAIGVLQSWSVYLTNTYKWLPDSGLSEFVPLAIVLVFLLVRGRPLPDRGALVEQTLGRVPRPHSIAKPAVIGGLIGLAALLVFHESYRGAIITGFIFGIFALSFIVITGFVGQISLAQVSLGGVAAFLLSHLTTDWGVPFPIAPLIAAAGAAIVGVVVGLPALRIRGLLVAVVTLMLAVTLEAAWFRNPTLSGGAKGGRFVKPPRMFGIDFRIGAGRDFPRIEFGVLCLVVFLGLACFVAWLRRSRLGSAMLAVRANERSAAAAGISVVRVKLIGFAISSYIAGIAGALLAYRQPRVTFQSYSALENLNVFTTAFIAGITTVVGAVVMAVIAVGGIVYTAFDRAIEFGNWYEIITGLGLVFAVIFNPEGIAGAMKRDLGKLYRKIRGVQPAPPVLLDLTDVAVTDFEVAAPDGAPVGANLSVRDVSISYSGVIAVNSASFDVPRGQIVGLIGPNGAGKTTMMDGICGFVRTSGSIVLDRESLDGLPPHRRAQAGIGRTFQALDLYDDLSVYENVVVGQNVGAVKGEVADQHLEQTLALLGLDALRDRLVGDLSQGHRQLASIARSLAGSPKLLLLDEPAAGLDSAESQWLARRLRRVRDSGVTVLLVDHDMNLVLNLCDLIHVLDFGSVIASGSPQEVRKDRRVAEAYLGSGHAPAADVLPVGAIGEPVPGHQVHGAER
jgi:ABC-type branched-subunit amino acid transport system ATPase component/ABC-type branched-subunit amino acid transport system permease subunit